jgi:hypothetical protein
MNTIPALYYLLARLARDKHPILFEALEAMKIVL